MDQVIYRPAWATNAAVVVEAAQDLAQPSWSLLSKNTLTDGAANFSDPLWTNHPFRLYRVRTH